MKSILKFLFLILLSFTLISCENPSSPWKDLSGNTYQKNDFKGKWLIINYWASWCKSCYGEIAELNRVHQKNKNIILLGVNFDLVPINEQKVIAEKMKVEFPVLQQDPAVELNLGEIPQLPVTFIFSPDGKLYKRLVGPQTEKELEKIVSHQNTKP
ncbi:MAG: TlpA family protein disulfide reductase [Proteobacteria bacterium]|nr:TlpA family protein disulfide reductase [Pseudomonadota bacterium]